MANFPPRKFLAFITFHTNQTWLAGLKSKALSVRPDDPKPPKVPPHPRCLPTILENRLPHASYVRNCEKMGLFFIPYPCKRHKARFCASLRQGIR